MPPVNPIQAAIAALVVDVGAVVVGFGVLNNATAGIVETAVIGVATLGFVIANALHHNANATVAAAKAKAAGSGR